MARRRSSRGSSRTPPKPEASEADSAPQSTPAQSEPQTPLAALTKLVVGVGACVGGATALLTGAGFLAECAYAGLLGTDFRQPKEGLGFDQSPSAHMWRTINWPTRYL